VLEGEVHEDQVLGAAEGLVDAGLVWEASRLVGQGAVRTTDPALARALLERARDTKGLLPAERGEDAAEAAAAGPSVLSERELEVGGLVLDGLTHKEIGAQLYLSPKTVEHHVAKIRQKLGVSTRAEMLAALRRLSSAP
jgi:DNA-binding NarL/FixJ family response regulator